MVLYINSHLFKVSRGTRQGSIISPVVFNIFLSDNGSIERIQIWHACRLTICTPHLPTQTHDLFLLLCVCTTRVLHMFTQVDLLIVNHGHSYIDYACAMCFWEHMERFVIMSGAAIWVYATKYLTERA